MRVARQSRFHRILDQGISRRKQPSGIVRKFAKGTAEPALAVRQCRPLGGDGEAGARGYLYPVRSSICCTLVMFLATTLRGMVSALKPSPPRARSAGLSIFTPLAAGNSLLPLAK